MTKIKAVSTKAPATPPCELKEKIDLFTSCPDKDLTSHLAAFTRWDYPKGDLHQWIAPLNRFDDILEKAVKNHGFRENLKIQKAPFPSDLKECLCQVMRVTTLLFGNCSYRTIYGSASYIYELLGSTDLDILENALRLVTCFAARTAQRPDPSNTNFIVPKNRLWKFATGEGINSRQPPFPDLKSLLSSEVVIPPNWAGYHFHYYKRAPSSTMSSTSIPPRSASNTQFSPVTPTPKSRDGGDHSQRGLDSNMSSDGKTTEGWVRLHISLETIVKHGIEPTFRDLVVQANIPKDDQFRLFVQVMEAYYYSSAARREQFLRSNVSDSNAMEKQLYSARPEIIQQLVRLLHNDSEAGIWLKTIVLRTLRTLARNSIFASSRRTEESRFHQILNALDSNLNHGILMTLLRENISLLQSKDPSVEEMQYSQALHRLIREFLESPQGASNLGFAGVVPLFVEILKIERRSVWSIIVSVAELLATLLPHQRHNQLLPLFMEADGLNTVVRVIKRHVDYNLSIEPQDEGVHHSLLSFPEHQSLHSFLNFLNRLLKTGHGERVRNVVDSEVIGSLKQILNDLVLFGGDIGWQASKLLAVIIHNEPTSYAALHENGLPQAFLKMITTNIPPTSELISCIPNVFDAICINTQGKELFYQHNFEGFFDIFKSLEHCKVMTKGHCASDCGAGMDELLRHHPELKDTFLKSYIQMMQDVCHGEIMNQSPIGPKLPEIADMSALTSDTKWLPCKLNQDDNLTKARIEEERNVPVLLLARTVLAFAEGFFSTVHWIKDFLKEDGHLLLLGILNAPSIPYDFGETRDGHVLRTLMVQFVEQNGPTVVPPLLNATREIVAEITNCPVSLPIKNIVDPANLDFDVGELNRLLRLYSRLHSHLAVLQSIYNQTTNMQGRPNVAHTVPFSVSENVEMLTSIGEVIREVYWRGNQLLRSLPKKYRDALPLDQLDGNGRRRSDKTELPDDLFMKKHGFPRRDPTYRNVEMLQYIVSFLPKKVLKFFAGTPRYILGSCTGLSNSLVTRAKLSDPTQRTTALTVLDCLSDIFLDLLRNGEALKEGQTIDVHLYWFCVTNFIHSILGGGRYPDDVVDFVGVEAGQPGYDKSLQTLLLSRFHSKGGLAALLDITKSLAESLPTLDKDNPADNERLLAIPANLKKLFSLIRLFTTDSIINESPQSGYLTNRDRHKDQGHYFLVSTFLTDTRATCLPVLTDLLSLLNKFDKVTTQLLLSTLCDLILGGPEEFHSDAGKYESEPEEDSLHRLSQHGFDRGHAYAALMAHGNVEAAALEYLLSRRNVVPPPQPGDMSRSPSPPFQAGMDEFVEHRALPFPPLPGQPVNPQGDTHAMDIDPSADTHMDIDPPNPEATSSSSVDKGKAVEVVETRVETLARLRTEFSGNLENYVTDILVYHPDLPFELARLIKSVGKWESNEWIQERMLELAARLASLEDDKRTKAKEIAACAHVLGLLLSEKRYYDNAEAGIVVFLDSFVGFLSVEEEIETPWISSVSLIIEIIVREIEWRQCKKRQDPTFNLDIPEIEPEFYRRLLDKLINILKSDLADETVVLCVLRLLIHLTRDGQYARVFREKNGIQNLLQLNYRHAGKTTFKVTDPTIIIIRQIVEDDKIVLATMRSVVQSVLDVGANRGRYVDLSELLRNKHAEVLRDPNLFSHAVEQLAKLVGWSSSNPNSHKLSKKQSEQTVAYPPKPENDVQVKDTKPDLPETPKKSTLELSYSSGVVQILLTELLSHHADATPSTKKEEAPISTNTGLAQGTDSNNVPPNQSRSKLTPEEAKDYAYTLFLLQALSELVGSYSNCKLEFVNYSRRGQSREPLTPSKPRSMMLNYLLNDLLPTGVASYTVHASQDMDLERRRGISQLVSSVISSLCKKTPEFYEHDDRPDLLVNVRKFVLEGIARSLKETLVSTGPAQQRYSRYTSLAELCRKLLASQMPLPMAQMQIDVASSSEMAKLMFEKGFVGLLTSVVAEIELDFPDVRLVINDVLSSLRDLTTSINRLAATSSFDAGSATGDVEEISTASSVSEEDEMQDRDETPDVFRNSALGILQGEVEDNGHRNHNHHHHLDYQEYDEVMDYDDDDDDDDEDDEEDLESESGSDDSEMDEEDGDDEMNIRAVEIVMDDGEEDDDDSDGSSDLSDESEGMEDDEPDEGDEGSHGDSIIDMLEEQQMEDQVDGADGWTTDSDSAEEEEEMEEEVNEDELSGFLQPDWRLNPEEQGMDYSDEDLDDGADIAEFREVMGNLQGQIFDDMQDEEEEEEEQDDGNGPHRHHHHSWLSIVGRGGTNTLRHGGRLLVPTLFTREGLQFRGGLFGDDFRRTMPHRSVGMPNAPPATASIHPMMVNAQAPPQQRSTRSVTRISQIGSSAPTDLLRSMEQIFGVQNMLTDLMVQLGEGQQTTISFELRSNPGGTDLLPRIVRMRGQVPGGPPISQDEVQHPFKMAQDFMIFETAGRWQQAANMWYQNAAADRAAIFEQSIFKLLEPAAIDEEKTRKAKEDADRKAAEAAKKAKEEEEKRIAQEEAEARAKAEAEAREREEAEARAREEELLRQLAEEQAERERLAAEALIESSNAPGFLAMDGVEISDTAIVPPEPEDQPLPENNIPEQAPAETSSTERIFTVMRGNRVDITGLGVDPEFLEALPEEMREEVLYQHIRERRAAAPPDEPSTLDPSFLEALPPDIRAELLEEEAAERRRQERVVQRQQAGQTTAPTGPVDLDPASFIASLDGPLRQAVLLDQDDDFLQQLPPHIVAEATALRERMNHRFGGPIFGRHQTIATEPRRKQQTTKRKDGIQLLEKSGLATLIRLTFLRNRPEALQDILLELCRHRPTRIEVVGLLLSILQEGSADVAAVERSFSQLSLKVKGQDQALSPLKSKAKMDPAFISHISGENSPTLIARHCLELLNHLIKNNYSLPFYFLTEHESLPALKRANSKKGKGKEVATKESRYPLNALLSLLERSAILDTKASTEEFARLLADVTKPLLSLQRKSSAKSNDKPEEANAPPSTEPASISTGGPAQPVPAIDAQEPPATEATAEASASSSAPPKSETPPVRLTPPVVSEHNLELLVLILVAKEVSRETFRATLATMHHLMAVPGALDVFGRGLAREAQRYGDIAQSDLWDISEKLKCAQKAGNLKDVDLTAYTSRGADQTKLLKIFKAIDYLFNRIQRDGGDEKEKEESQAGNRQDALGIYSQLSLNPLWENLSMCLGYLRENSDTWPLAQPLLPMIESLLVACNHINTSSSGKRIPNSPEAERIESLFFKFTEEHRKILNYLVHMQPSLMSGSFEMLAHNPKVLEFDNKRNYFNRKLHDRKGQRVPTRSISLNIRRDMVFLDSFRSLCFRTGEEVKNARLNVRFQGEEGVDAGGLTREWYQVLARQMFDPNYALFTPVASDSATFHPNKSSYVNDEHLMFFKFVGRIIGKALFDGRLLDCHFSRAVYKHILNRPISVKDLEYYDNTYYKNLMWMLENSINDIVTETFSIEAEEYGVIHIIDLVPEGRTIPVTDENKTEYVRLVSEYKLQTSVKDQLKEFLTGFHDIIPSDLVSIFTEQELELLISGLPDIDIEDWKAHSTYSNYDASSPQIQWFWRAVRSFDKEERAKLLQFATGTSKVPLNGFKELEGMQGTTKFTIVRDFGHKTRLPQSHTCFNQIDLPEYDSYEQLRSALLTAITMGTEGFGFA